MNITPLVARQVFIMLILIIVGFVLAKKNLVSEKGAADMSNVLLTIVTPCVLIQAYQIECDAAIMHDIGLAFMLSIVLHALFIPIAYIVFMREKNADRKKINIFTSVYSNCGFMGIPLLAATLGEKGVLLGSAYLAMFNIIAWTQGLYLYGGSIKVLSLKNLVKNAGVMGSVIALVLFCGRIRLTGVLDASVDYIASLNTPLAMILLGAYLARTQIGSALKNASVYAVIALRLLILPVAAILLFSLLGINEMLATALVLPAACPSAAIGALFAQKFGMDAGYPSQIVSASTVISLATLPLVAYIASLVL